MRIMVVGGGPAGLFFAALALQAQPVHEITVLERNAADDTFGFGVVFSDETLNKIAEADPIAFDSIRRSFIRWNSLEIRRGRQVTGCRGHGFAGIARQRLLSLLQQRADELGADLHFRHELVDLSDLAGFDLIVGADGVNSLVRQAFSTRFRPTVEPHRNKFMWCGTDARFDSFTFIFEETPSGVFQAHVYPYERGQATFLIETDEGTWARAGLNQHTDQALAPGVNDFRSLAACEGVFRRHLAGASLLGNNSKWLNFSTVTNRSWWAENVVLLGDAAHTAHWSIGSGTKLAMEDAIGLSRSLSSHSDLTAALAAYEHERKPEVERVQRAARPSLEWFERTGCYRDMPRWQFAFSLLTRSQRVTHDNLSRRDPAFMRSVRGEFARRNGLRGRGGASTPPMFTPLRLRGLELANRIVVSAMDQYSATDGLIGDWHFVHLGSRAVGGAGLVMTEMTCVAPDGRISPGCAGMWTDEHCQAWKRVVSFVHTQAKAGIGLQLGHAGRKGATKLMWEGDLDPLPTGGWPLIAASSLRYRRDSAVPRSMNEADMDRVIGEFARATTLGAQADFDLIELHAAHGYLLASFISPLTNRRVDQYGGSLRNRMRFPVAVLEAVRSVWPSDKPISVRFSATDWQQGGLSTADALEVARLFVEHGADIINVSTGQTTPAARPVYGRLWQVPFSDHIRNALAAPTIATGGISSVDDVNTILLAGRADLCAIARPHLIDPYWTLNAALDQNFELSDWPLPYLSGRTARRRAQQPFLDGPAAAQSQDGSGQQDRRNTAAKQRATMRARPTVPAAPSPPSLARRLRHESDH